jgi:hypothetical protein
MSVCRDFDTMTHVFLSLLHSDSPFSRQKSIIC